MSFNPFSSNPQRSNDFEDYLEQGAQLIQRGDLQGALRCFEKSIQLNRHPDENPAAYLNRGLVLIDLQQPEAAIKSFDIVIKEGILPALFHAYLYKGEALRQMQKTEEAEAVLSAGISAVGNPSAAYAYPSWQLPAVLSAMHYNRGQYRVKQSRFREAVQDYTRAIQLDNSDIDYYVSRCIALLKSGDRDGAQKDYAFIRANEPNHPALSLLAGELGSGSAVHMRNDTRASNIDLRAPTGKYPQSAEKLEAAKQLIEEGQYDVAALVLGTMSSPNAAQLLQKTSGLIFNRSLQSHILGVLEEWILENYPIFTAHLEILRDARTYLYCDYVDRKLAQTILDKLKTGTGLDNTLSNSDFTRVYLDDADLTSAEAVNTDFSLSSLQNVNFRNSNLLGSSFVGADLQMANFSGAYCENANFTRANLRGADFTGANLSDADLYGAFMRDAKFDEKTTLPDWTFWTPRTDLGKYTSLKSAFGDAR